MDTDLDDLDNAMISARADRTHFLEMARERKDRAEQCDQKSERARDPDAPAASWRNIAKHYLRLAGEYHI
jgi:hypothetical protein